nr:MAG: terminase large subunit [Caudoviricetes sp.]
MDPGYMPSLFAIQFVNFIKAVNGGSEENKTPILHLHMLDRVGEASGSRERIANMVFRGAAKTTLMGEYLFLYLGMYGCLPLFGRIELALYVSDSIDNGVKNMRKNLEYRYDNSDFLKAHMSADFTDIRWKFTNKDGNVFIVKGYGAKTGVRGAKEMGKRPRLAVLDDLISDEDARSPTVIASVEDTVYKAVQFALHPEKNMIIWSGTPFNAKDPLYKAIESGAWKVNVYPVCEQYPCTRQEFRSAWPDRFTYDGVKAAYDAAVKLGRVDTVNQELMLRIMSEDDRLISDGEIMWYDLDSLMENKHAFNYYITTDLATSTKQAADFSVISVWAYNSDSSWFYVDGICKRQDMGSNVEDMFRLVSKWKPQSVGIEVSATQLAFISWFQTEMIKRNVYFNFASENNKREPGIRPVGDKIQRLNMIVPMFKMHKVFFPKQLRYGVALTEMYNELSLASPGGLRSKKDDFIDTISMLAMMKPIAPSSGAVSGRGGSSIWEEEDLPEVSSLSSYLV